MAEPTVEIATVDAGNVGRYNKKTIHEGHEVH